MGDLAKRDPTDLAQLQLIQVPAVPELTQALAVSRKHLLVDLSSMGVAFEPVAQAVQNVVGGQAGSSGLYYVNTKGLQLAQFKDGSGYLGSLLTKSGTVGGGQAALTPLACNPTALFMAVALMNIDSKLNEIQAVQRDILDYLRAQEDAKLQGDISVLNDVMSHYKFNWENKTFKDNSHILVQNIRKDAEQSMILSRSEIEKRLVASKGTHGDKQVNKTVDEIRGHFDRYHLALYLFSYSSFVEVMLLENFDSNYLESISKGIEERAFEYRSLYTKCYNRLEKFARGSLQTAVARGLSGVTRGAGEAIGRLPLVSKGLVDEALIAAGDKLGERTEEKVVRALGGLVDSADACATPFADNIKMVDKLLNGKEQLLIDGENIYMLEGKDV